MGSGPLRASLVFDRPDMRRNQSMISPANNCLQFRRFSSAVEQRFCKPKVGSSILSTGTMISIIYLVSSETFLVRGSALGNDPPETGAPNLSKEIQKRPNIGIVVAALIAFLVHDGR
jgi:hypothetical protein